MSKRTVVVMPETQRILSIMGEQIKTRGRATRGKQR